MGGSSESSVNRRGFLYKENLGIVGLFGVNLTLPFVSRVVTRWLHDTNGSRSVAYMVCWKETCVATCDFGPVWRRVWEVKPFSDSGYLREFRIRKKCRRWGWGCVWSLPPTPRLPNFTVGAVVEEPKQVFHSVAVVTPGWNERGKSGNPEQSPSSDRSRGRESGPSSRTRSTTPPPTPTPPTPPRTVRGGRGTLAPYPRPAPLWGSCR